MDFMQQQITEKMDGWEVETENGTSFVPDDVVSVPGRLRFGAIVERMGVTADEVTVFDLLASRLSDYVDGHGIWRIEAITDRYFARMSAPGYLDCTDWAAFKTLAEARAYLREYCE